MRICRRNRLRFDDDNIPCRLDPEDAIKVLELKPGADYTPKTETEILWKSGLSIGNPHEDFQGSRELLRSADRTINIAPGTKLYLNLKENKGVIVSGNDIVNLKEPLEIDGIPVLLYGGICGNIHRGQIMINLVKNKYLVG